MNAVPSLRAIVSLHEYAHQLETERSWRDVFFARKSDAVVADRDRTVIHIGRKDDGDLTAPAARKCMLERVRQQLIHDQTERNGDVDAEEDFVAAHVECDGVGDSVRFEK